MSDRTDKLMAWALIAYAMAAVTLGATVLALVFMNPAKAAEALQPGPGAMCSHLTERYSTKADRLTLESVRVLELAPLPSGTPGAWVMPVAGPMAWAQFHVSQESLTECQP